MTETHDLNVKIKLLTWTARVLNQDVCVLPAGTIILSHLS